MPWGYRGSYPSQRPVSSNVWQRAGETMSLNNACARYGVTEQQCIDAKIECKWRSSFGNPYAVVKCSDIAALKERLDQEEEDKKEQALIAKHGKEGYAKMKQEEKERKEAQVAAAKAAADAAKTKEKIVKKMAMLLPAAEGGIASVEGLKLAKTTAKKEWFLNDSDLVSLTAETNGKVKKYNVRDLITKAQVKHSNLLESKIKSSKNYESRLKQYAGYLKEKIDDEMSKLPSDLVSEAIDEARASLQAEKDKSAATFQAAEKDLEEKQSRVRSFDLLFEHSAADKENAAPSKKAKTK